MSMGSLLGLGTLGQMARPSYKADRAKIEAKYNYPFPNEYFDIFEIFGKGDFVNDALILKVCDYDDQLTKANVENYFLGLRDDHANDPTRPSVWPASDGLFPWGWSDMAVTMSWRIDSESGLLSIVTSDEELDYFYHGDMFTYLYHMLTGNYSAVGIAHQENAIVDKSTIHFIPRQRQPYL